MPADFLHLIAFFIPVLCSSADGILFVLSAAWPADDRQEKVLVSVLLNLLKVRDDHQQDRVRLAFEDRQFGILPSTKLSLEHLEQVRQLAEIIMVCVVCLRGSY